ncbi:hypothetical protein ACH5RR_038904 [Cinchona calisaya]|uniref:Uncharacterized protein n=1 Tax=Cinchona calisaya TaxID=153742 RepID=A0ABD2XZ58_9GENT
MASIAASIFSVTIITSEQHRKAALDIGKRIQQQILGTSFERLLEHSDRFAELFRVIELNGFDPSPLHTRVKNLMTHISKQVDETSSANERKLKHLEAIQAKRISLEDRKAELMKELEQLEVETQGVDAEILKVNEEMSRDQHLMAYLASEQTNLKNTPVVSSKDSEDFEALHIFLEEERAEVAQLKWMD